MTKRILLTALVLALAFCGTASARPTARLAVAQAHTAVATQAQHDALLDGGTSGTATDCHRLTRTKVECWAHEYGIQTTWVDGPADLAYPVTVTLSRGRMTFDSAFV